MPKKPPPKLPLASFGPELRAIFRAGAKEKKVIKMSTLRDARNLQARLHIFRKRMQEEGDSEYALAAGVRVGIDSARPWRANNPASIIVQPHDKEFTDPLRAAGIVVDVPTTSAPEVGDNDTTSEEEDILNSIGSPLPPKDDQ